MYARTPSWIRRHTTPTLRFLTNTWRGVSYSKKKSVMALVIWLFIFCHRLTRRDEGLSLSRLANLHINAGDSTSSTPPGCLGLLPPLVARVLCLLS